PPARRGQQQFGRERGLGRAAGLTPVVLRLPVGRRQAELDQRRVEFSLFDLRGVAAGAALGGNPAYLGDESFVAVGVTQVKAIDVPIRDRPGRADSFGRF